MFTLSTGVPIDEEGIVTALQDYSGNNCYFFDTISGDVGVVQIKTENKILQKLVKDPRYKEVPPIAESSQIEWFNEFADTFLKEGNKKEQLLYKKIIVVLAENNDSLQHAISILDKSPTGWIHGWSQWCFDEVCGVMEDWLDSLNLGIEDVFDGDCDCELCKLFAKGEYTLGDFNEAAKKQALKDKNNDTIIKL
jgi:hypothetical protein